MSLCRLIGQPNIERHMNRTLPQLLLGSLLLTACSPIVRTHGNIVDPAELSQLRPGVSGQADVVAVLGSPSAEGNFTPYEWYYIGQVTKQTAFLAPDLSTRSVTKVTFDPNTGILKSIEQLDKDQGLAVSPVERTTPTAGHNLGVVEQVLGNVGRFNAPDKK
jgi:outer membrane protein assembly factor BamE (lipoprotein component of BamABCDE complex)